MVIVHSFNFMLQKYQIYQLTFVHALCL